MSAAPRGGSLYMCMLYCRAAMVPAACMLQPDGPLCFACCVSPKMLCPVGLGRLTVRSMLRAELTCRRLLYGVC